MYETGCNSQAEFFTRNEGAKWNQFVQPHQTHINNNNNNLIQQNWQKCKAHRPILLDQHGQIFYILNCLNPAVEANNPGSITGGEGEGERGETRTYSSSRYDVSC